MSRKVLKLALWSLGLWIFFAVLTPRMLALSTAWQRYDMVQEENSLDSGALYYTNVPVTGEAVEAVGKAVREGMRERAARAAKGAAGGLAGTSVDNSASESANKSANKSANESANESASEPTHNLGNPQKP